MTVADGLLIAALAVFLAAWWMRRTPRRPLVLLAAALTALIAGVAGVLDDRWQAGVGAVVAAVLLLVLLVNRLRKAKPRTSLPWISGPLLTLVVALPVAAILAFPVFALPKPTGAHPVGVRTFEITDTSRKGLLAARADEPRRLLVRVWYPAGDVAGVKRRRYFSQAEADTTARTMGGAIGFPPLFTYLKHVLTNSHVDAPLLPGARGLPVVIYSHGYTSFASQNTVLFEHLASHGYVVFSLQHSYDASDAVFPDGDVLATDPGLFKDMMRSMGEDGKPPKSQVDALGGADLDTRLEGQIRMREEGVAQQARIVRSGPIWLADRLFLHDRLQARTVPQPIAAIAAASDLTRVGEMGMSFGGATAGSVCMVDRRCAAGINLDGGDFPFLAFDKAMPVPFLMFHSDMAGIYRTFGVERRGPARGFNEFSYEPIAQAGMRPDLYRVQLLGANHLGLSDFSLFMRRPVRNPLFGSAPAAAMIGAQNDFVLSFFDRHLRGVANGFPGPQMKAYAGKVAPAPNADLRAWWAAKSEAERAAITGRIERARADPKP